MFQHEIQAVLSLMEADFPDVEMAIQERIDQSPSYADEYSPFSFAVPSIEITLEVYDLLRPTDWFIVAVPDGYLGKGMLRASLRRKRFIEAPPICYHATPVTEQESIDKKGLLPGITLGKSGRSKTFADSPYYIFASLTEDDAVGWSELFEEEEFVIYPVKVGGGGIRLFIDPCSVDSINNKVSGYIIDADHVPRSLLDDPIPVSKL